MENPSLKELQESLPHWFTYFKSDDILAISLSKDDLPYAFVINDDDRFLISLAVDCHHANVSAALALYCSDVKMTAITESFYIAKNGTTHTNDDAYKYYELDLELPLDEIDPSSATQH